MTRILITGVTGQDGYYLAKEALGRSWEVYGLVRGQNNPKEAALKAELPDVRIIHGDLLDSYSINEAVRQARPHYIFNLGALTFIPTSWSQPALAIRVIVEGTLNVLNAAVWAGVETMVQASTSEMFGNAAKDGVADETTPMLPVSPYGTAKLAAHHLCRNYRSAYDLNAVSAIMFNHESPRRGPEFVTRKIVMAAAAISKGSLSNLVLGNTGAMRDWGWAPEYMDGLCRIALSGKQDSYVLATGQTASVQQFTECVFNLAGLSLERVLRDNVFIRPSELHYLRGCSQRIKDELEWSPTIEWREVAKRMYLAEVER